MTNDGFSYSDIKHLRLCPFIRSAGGTQALGMNTEETVMRFVSEKEKNIENLSRLAL
ncbi:MAG: hypothetical protein MZV70_26300 [Desulfobacterales bacterium]|nr:hypothetical protein [Desulfobacterales bacterium]